MSALPGTSNVSASTGSRSSVWRSPAAGHMPGMVIPWTCPEVRVLFPAGIALSRAGVDPQGLDRNGDGTACGTGD